MNRNDRQSQLSFCEYFMFRATCFGSYQGRHQFKNVCERQIIVIVFTGIFV